MSRFDYTRRDSLKVAGLGAASLALGGCGGVFGQAVGQLAEH
jgi:hypothetical protein